MTSTCHFNYSNGTGLLEEEHVETPTTPKSEPEEVLEPEEQISNPIDTFETVVPKEEPSVEPVQPEEPVQPGRWLSWPTARVLASLLI